MKDYADRTWCIDPYSKEWRDAQLKEFRAKHPELEPKVKISSALPRIDVKFQREYCWSK